MTHRFQAAAGTQGQSFAFQSHNEHRDAASFELQAKTGFAVLSALPYQWLPTGACD